MSNTGASALEEVFEVREITIRTWLCRGGMQGKNPHERFVTELQLLHVQLDELWANVKDKGQDMWLWIASDVKTKIIPVFSTDGLRHYFFALTAHFEKWETV